MSEVMVEAYKRGWITTRDGNISIRRDTNFYITPSAVRKNVMRTEDMIKMKIKGGKHIITPDDSKPSIEQEMHELIQLSDTKTKAVVHLHPTYTIATMYSGRNVLPKWALKNLADQFPELRRYTKVGPVVPFSEPGSKELAEAVYKAIAPNGKIEYDIIGMEGHGVVAVGKHPWDAFEHIERLEHICQIHLVSGE